MARPSVFAGGKNLEPDGIDSRPVEWDQGPRKIRDFVGLRLWRDGKPVDLMGVVDAEG